MNNPRSLLVPTGHLVPNVINSSGGKQTFICLLVNGNIYLLLEKKNWFPSWQYKTATVKRRNRKNIFFLIVLS